jgi:plastocyanin
MRKAIAPMICALMWFGLASFLVFAAGPSGGEIVGTLSVPKTERAVVYVETVTGAFHGDRAKMDQRNKLFTPFVLPVVKGTTVEFVNSDELQHNVFGVGAEEFNLGNWTKGITREHTFNKLGEVAILCNVHPEMEAYILVLQNPFFAQPDGSGKFRIAGVPPGDYVVKAWYSGKTKKQSVKVPATGSVTVAF